jgi:hypothetical protein
MGRTRSQRMPRGWMDTWIAWEAEDEAAVEKNTHPPGGRLACSHRFSTFYLLFLLCLPSAPAPEDLRTAHLWRSVDVGELSCCFPLSALL